MMFLCARGDSSNWATPPCSVKPCFYWLLEAHSRTPPWPRHRWIDGSPKTEAKVAGRAAHWSRLLIRYILSEVSVLALFLSVSVMSVCLAPCYGEQTGLRGDYEMSLQHNNSLHPARNAAVGEGKKQELDVVSFCWKAAFLCGPLSESRVTST